MSGLEEVSIDDLLNNSADDKDTGPAFIYKKSSTYEEDIDDNDNDDAILKMNEDEEDEFDVEIEDDDDAEDDADIDPVKYENGPKFKETDNKANTNYTLPSFITGGGGGENELDLGEEGGADNDDGDGDEEEEDANYLQKFDTAIRENFIEKYHPEAKNHNFEEVKHMSRVVRNENGIIMDNLHKTLPFLTKYETARILGQRAKQLNSGAKSFVKIPPNVIDGYEIAKLELEEKKIPFIIKRPIPDGTCEYWNVSDLEIL